MRYFEAFVKAPSGVYPTSTSHSLILSLPLHDWLVCAGEVVSPDRADPGCFRWMLLNHEWWRGWGLSMSETLWSKTVVCEKFVKLFFKGQLDPSAWVSPEDCWLSFAVWKHVCTCANIGWQVGHKIAWQVRSNSKTVFIHKCWCNSFDSDPGPWKLLLLAFIVGLWSNI